MSFHFESQYFDESQLPSESQFFDESQLPDESLLPYRSQPKAHYVLHHLDFKDYDASQLFPGSPLMVQSSQEDSDEGQSSETSLKTHPPVSEPDAAAGAAGKNITKAAAGVKRNSEGEELANIRETA